MSNALINDPAATHTFVDDLESTVYILMWMTLAYSSINEPTQAKLFLSNTLDPQPVQGQGGLAKSDFLKGRSFLNQYSFPGRGALHNLVDKLADMLSIRYTTLTDKDKEISERLKKMAEDQPDSIDAQRAYEDSPVEEAKIKRAQLHSHDAAIVLFDTALEDPSMWPSNDAAEKQNFAHSKLDAEIREKTDFDPSLTVGVIMGETNHDTDSDHESHDTVRNLFGVIDKPHGDSDWGETDSMDCSDVDEAIDNAYG